MSRHRASDTARIIARARRSRQEILTVAVSDGAELYLYPAWYAVRCKTNREAAVAAALERAGLTAYLPTYRSERRRVDRVVLIDMPLFPGYCFAQLGTEAEHADAAHVRGVAQILGRASNHEIATVRLVCDAMLKPKAPYTIGQRVTILERPLHGVTGIVRDLKRGGARVIVALRMLGRDCTIELPASVLSG